jgi:hypothetical protein
MALPSTGEIQRMAVAKSTYTPQNVAVADYVSWRRRE